MKFFESFQVLYDANIAYKNNLFFVAMSGYWVFVENYLRQQLIYASLPEDRTGNPFQLFQRIDEVEKEIEENQYKDLNVESLK